MLGSHWETDDLKVWTLVLKILVGSGPGWDYIIQGFELKGKGNGQKAYKELQTKALWYTNNTMLVNKCRMFYCTSTWNRPTMNTSFDQFVRVWYQTNEILTKHNLRSIEINIVTDFCNAIYNPWIACLTNSMLNESAEYTTSFDKAVTEVLSHMNSITQKEAPRCSFIHTK